MANPTNPFSWQMPTSTDLVTDLPADFEVFGQAVATSMADLLGGTTGQVLTKSTATDMDFTWANGVDTAPVSYGFTAGKSKIINGDFGYWQRGTTFNAVTTGTYLADRFLTAFNGSGSTRNITQQTFTPGTAPVAGYESQYFLRYDQTVAGTSATFSNIGQRIEDVRAFAGQTVTVSFWAKAAATTTVGIGFTQNFGGGGSASVSNDVPSAFSVGTSWARYSYSLTIASISGKTIGTNSFLLSNIQLPLNSTFTLDIWGFQLENGSTATAFQTATGTKQGELAACQRYYYRLTPTGVTRVGAGYVNLTTSAAILINFPVQMRTSPTALEQSGTASDYSVANSTTTVCSVVPTFSAASVVGGQTVFDVSAGLTVGQAIQARLVNTNAYLGWSAEL